MPLFSELGWILEIAKLLGRFAPLVDRLLPSAGHQFPPAISEEAEAELRQQATAFRGRLEAYLSDLRKQAQEQNLKLRQMQEDLNALRNEVENTARLSRDLKDQMRSLRLWLFVTFGVSCLSVVLLMVALLRH